MKKYINEEIEFIKINLALIIQQNRDIKNQLEKISTALLLTDNTENYSKAVEDFLKKFMNNYY